MIEEFEEYLTEIFIKTDGASTLDDDIPEAVADWISEMDDESLGIEYLGFLAKQDMDKLGRIIRDSL